MGGLAKICKIYGGMTVTDASGNKIEWVYDYKNDRARLKKEMTEQEFVESEKAKYDKIKQIYDKPEKP